jgi:hypothetical protein
MVRGIRIVIYIFIFLSLNATFLRGQEDPRMEQFLNDLQQQGVVPENRQWNEEFSQSFSRLYQESSINPQTLDVIARSLRDSTVSGDPREAAADILEVTRNVDREIRRGRKAKIVREELRQHLERRESENVPEVAERMRNRAKERVRNNLENRGRGNIPNFIPPGLEKKEQHPGKKMRDRYPPPHEEDYDEGEAESDDGNSSPGPPEDIPRG